MLKLSEAREAYEDASGKLSDINRQLCFAGFGIIWLYNMSGDGIQIPKNLFLPGLLLIISLVLDVLQYVYTSLCWHIYYDKHTSPEKDEEEIPFKEPRLINVPSWSLFWAKVGVMLSGYVFIGKFLISKIIES